MYSDRCLPALPYDDENAFTVQYSEYLPQSRIFQPKLSNIRPYPTDLLRIEFDSTRCKYYTQIDAVRLSGWAELTDTTISRWPGQLEASSSSSLSIDVNTDSVEQSNNRSQNTLSFFSDLLRPCTPRLRASSYNIPPVGMNLLLLQSRNLVALPPGTICQSSLFGLTYLNEDALWRHGPLTRLPVSSVRIHELHRCFQFRCLVKDTLANMTSIDLQSFWPILNDSTLISLGKRLGQVNLTERAVAEYYTTGQSLVAPITLLRRQCREEEERNNDEIENQYVANQQHSSNTRYTYRAHTPFAARVRSYSSNAAARLLNHTRLLDSIPSDGPAAEALQVQTDELSQSDYFELPNSHLRRLDMSWCGNYSMISPTAFGHFLTDACRYLTTLRLSSCKFLNDDCLLHIVNTCPYIKELDLSSCLGITSYGFLTLGRLIHLQWISLYRTHITDNGLAILAELCQYLKHVNLGSCIDINDIDHILHNLTRNNPNLRSLNLWRCNSLTAIGISTISEHCLQLEELDIGWCRNVVSTQESNCIVHLTSRVQHLKKLFLTGTNLLNSEELLLIGQYVGATLEQLDIHGSTNITISAITSILNQCSKLKLLDVSFCPEIHSGNLIKLRYLYPFCTIIDSIPDMNAEILGNRLPEMIIDEVDDMDEENIVGNHEPLALPAPNPLQAIDAHNYWIH
ncbi:fbxl4, putative [Schistosoma mansoni]|uniref:fbxl4, putative n=1 Tax=Schistosoma mansoni TaxID=6183 RepID=UPI00022C8134|nr:fbxl4, putative [Schistosoma mansoni]|eukprot:XP_018645199.1 fbxl4, putative [Schistosoma mansoni]